MKYYIILNAVSFPDRFRIYFKFVWHSPNHKIVSVRVSCWHFSILWHETRISHVVRRRKESINLVCTTKLMGNETFGDFCLCRFCICHKTRICYCENARCDLSSKEGIRFTGPSRPGGLEYCRWYLWLATGILRKKVKGEKVNTGRVKPQKPPKAEEVSPKGLNFMTWNGLSKYNTTSFLIYIFHISQNCGLFTESGEFLLWHEVILSFGSPQKLAKA